MGPYLKMCTNLFAAAQAYATADEMFENIDRYLLIYQDIKTMGFEVEDELVCRLIMIARADVQSVVNALLTLHVDSKQ